MTIQSFLCALLPALLLAAPLCAAEPLTAAEIVRNDTTEETIQPPQTRAQAQNEETRDWSRSVVSPVPWLTVEDHVLTVYDESGSKVFCGVYPSLRLVEDDASPLAKALIAWNAEIGTSAWHSPVRRESEAARAERGTLHFAYSDITPITAWGRVDERVISFFMKGSSYAGGFHDIPHIEAYTFDCARGRQIALDEIVTDRTALIDAVAAAFCTQYPNAPQEDFPRGIREALLMQHPADQGLTSFYWYIAADGSLIIYYPVSTLTSYTAGDFSLTITREDAPNLFRNR